MLASWFRATGRNWAVFIHDDGTLPADAREWFEAQFPSGRIIRRPEADSTVPSWLSAFPACQDYRSRHPLALKIFDVPLFAPGRRFIILDSDILFFSKPDAILNWVSTDSEECWFNQDVEDATLITTQEALDKLGINLWPSVNSGLCLLTRDAVSLPLCEAALSNTTLPRGHFWRIEQTLFAVCASKWGRGGMLPPAYEVSISRRAAPGAVARHYVGAVRNLFYSEGLARLRPLLLKPR